MKFTTVSALVGLCLTSAMAESEQSKERLPLANISSDQSVMSTKLHCVQQFVLGGSVAGGKTFGNDSLSSDVRYVTTAGNSTEHMSAIKFCKQAGFDSCDPIKDTVSNLVYLGVAHANNQTTKESLNQLYGKKAPKLDEEVAPKHLSVVKEFQSTIQNNKSSEHGPAGIKITSAKKFDDNQVQIIARVAKKSCDKIPCPHYSQSAIRLTMNNDGYGEFPDLSIPAIFAANTWLQETVKMGNPSDAKVEYVGPLPEVIDVIGQLTMLMGSSGSSSSSPEGDGLIVDNSETKSNKVEIPTTLQLNYKIEILKDYDNDDKSYIDACGELSQGVDPGEASEVAQNLTTATQVSLQTASNTAPFSAATNRTTSSSNNASPRYSQSLLGGLFTTALGLFIIVM